MIWYAYNHSSGDGKAAIKKVFSGNIAGKKELLKIRSLISESGALDYTRNEITNLLNKSENIIKSSKMLDKYKAALINFSKKILSA